MRAEAVLSRTLSSSASSRSFLKTSPNPQELPKTPTQFPSNPQKPQISPLAPSQTKPTSPPSNQRSSLPLFQSGTTPSFTTRSYLSHFQSRTGIQGSNLRPFQARTTFACTQTSYLSQFLSRNTSCCTQRSYLSQFQSRTIVSCTQRSYNSQFQSRTTDCYIQRSYNSQLQSRNTFQSRSTSSTTQIPNQEPAPDSMDYPSSPIKVVSHLGGGGANGAIDAGTSIRKPLSLWPGMYHSPVTNALWEARSSIFERMLDPANGGQPPQTQLLTKTPAQSRTSIIYKFSTDFILREQYRDPWNEVRIGKLLEDLDALAGTIAVKHCSDDDRTTRPLLVVTASVDKMVLKKPLRIDTDVKIAGAVTYVGRSSIDIQIEVNQVEQDSSVQSDPLALTANFTFVARDSKTGKSASVNRLAPETEREKQLFREREARDKLRKRKREEQKGGVENGVHNFHAEAERLNALLAEGRVFCDLPALADRDSILLRDTCLENSLICQPQQRNLHGRIFGGFLMHRAFELAFSTAYAFVGQRPCFLEVDHVDFLKPVDVGDFLRFKSCVLYTQLENPDQPLVNVEVVAHVTRPELRKSEVSNTFYFTFTVNRDALKSGLKIRNVVPTTEEEARHILERMDAEKMFD